MLQFPDNLLKHAPGSGASRLEIVILAPLGKDFFGGSTFYHVAVTFAVRNFPAYLKNSAAFIGDGYFSLVLATIFVDTDGFEGFGHTEIILSLLFVIRCCYNLELWPIGLPRG